MNDTICAISTAPGNGAIAVIRLSGDEAISIVDKFFTPIGKKELQEAGSHSVLFGKIEDKEEVVDEVLISVFINPNTYTGEDIVEISCHGSVYIQQRILQIMIKGGARLAQPGEFTQRAYLNGKMDLSQAEAVSDLIASSSKEAHRIAMNQMRGGISKELTTLRESLLYFVSLIELELDFSEEDVEFADRGMLLELLNNIEKEIDKLIVSFELGNAIKNGIPVAIVGEPNVGKSTLLNSIINEEKAIVSHIAGTTRDTIEDVFNYRGIDFRFIDTAGLRKTDDHVESLGIERTYKKIEQAKVILALFDAKAPIDKVESDIIKIKEKAGDDKYIIIVWNKVDTVEAVPSLSEEENIVAISAKNKENIHLLLDKIWDVMHLDSIDSQDVIITNMRHVEALTLAMQSLKRAEEGINSGISNDFMAMDIRDVIHHLAGITGEEITTDEVLGKIFSSFCIGK